MGKQFDYFNAFQEMGRHSLSAGELLKETLETYDPAVLKERMAQIHTVEHSADTLKHQLTDQLIREFLPPIEREDIMELSDVIDDLTDAIEDVVIRLYMYNIHQIDPPALQFCGLIIECIRTLQQALEEFRHFKKSTTLEDLIRRVNELEENGDRLYAETMHELFATPQDPLAIMVWMEIYERLEKCCDRCEDVAKALGRAVLNNS